MSPTGIKTVWVPPGMFLMGSPGGEKGRGSDEGPQRRVKISKGYWIGAHPATQEEWARVMGGNFSHFGAGPAAGETQGRRPTENLSWHEAVEFANRLSMMEGLSPAYSIDGKTDPDEWEGMKEETLNKVKVEEGSDGWRLPTEAQWEYAARAGATAAFSDGSQDWENKDAINKLGWFECNSGKMTHEVGKKEPNAWGLYDVHGNVWEWCWDWYGDYPSQAQTDPRGASSGSDRVYRGGGGSAPAQAARSAWRGFGNPSVRGNFLGVRLLRP